MGSAEAVADGPEEAVGPAAAPTADVLGATPSTAQAQAPAAASEPSRLEEFGAQLLLRSRRARPGRIPPAPRIAVIAAWCACAAMAWAATLPFDPVAADGTPAAWVRILLYSGIAILTAVGVLSTVAASARSDGRFPWGAVWLPVAVAASSALPIVVGLAAEVPWFVATSLACALAGAAVATVMTARRRFGRGVLVAAASVLCAVPWLIAAIGTAGETEAGAEPLWKVVAALGVEVATLAAFYGFATAARGRVDGSRRVLAAGVSLRWVTVAVAVAGAVIVLRLTAAKSLFADPYDLWALRTPASWPMTLILAAAIVSLTLRSERRPLVDRGFGALIGILVVGFAYPSLIQAADSATSMIETLFGVPAPILDGWVECGPFNCFSFVWFGTAAALVIFLVVPRWRGTTARAAAIVSVPYLLAGTAAPTIDVLWPGGPAWWASPAPIALAILLIVAGIVAAQWCGLLLDIPRRALVRLAVYPVVVLHAVDLLPAFLTGPVQVFVAIALLAAVLLLFLPPVAADRVRHTAVVSGATFSVLFALAGTMLSTVAPGRESLTVSLATLMLAVPVMTALVLRAGRESPDQGASGPDW
ncbi:hypothetical protein ABZ477_18025 [Microbacterium sp. NPDC019599]|uniref:hypothetical protein n=1 Tax=Microbacterium sp. NPDC019599 TaxID=3154690 RepID=UPI00340A16EF